MKEGRNGMRRNEMIIRVYLLYFFGGNGIKTKKKISSFFKKITEKTFLRKKFSGNN